MPWIPSQVPKPGSDVGQDPLSETGVVGWGHRGRGDCPSRDVALGLSPPGAYRIEEHTARAGRADRESGAGGARNVHGAAAVPGGAWAGLLRGCGAATGGGSFERGGSHPPRVVALRTATALDPGHRHLNQARGGAGPVTHAQKPRRKRKWWAVCWIPGSVLNPMAAERDSDSTEPPGSKALLDAVLRTLYDLGERSF